MCVFVVGRSGVSLFLRGLLFPFLRHHPSFRIAALGWGLFGVFALVLCGAAEEFHGSGNLGALRRIAVDPQGP